MNGRRRNANFAVSTKIVTVRLPKLTLTSDFTAKEFLNNYWQIYLPDGEHKVMETCLRYLVAAVSDVPRYIMKAARHEPGGQSSSNVAWKQYCDGRGLALCTYAEKHLAPTIVSTLDDTCMLVLRHLTGHLPGIFVRTPGLLEEIVHMVITKSGGVYVIHWSIH